jgi:hypothetical protein
VKARWTVLVLVAACGDNIEFHPDARPPQPDGGCLPVEGAPALALELVVSGLDHPVDLASPPHDARRFVVEQDLGQVRLIDVDGTLVKAPVLVIDGFGGSREQGLLSIAFHPQFATNQRLFVSWARGSDEALVVDEYRMREDDPDRVDHDSRRTILEVEHTSDFHYGSDLEFGADGMLYLTVGDGGPRLDPEGHGQDLGSLRGKLLRLDVDGVFPYEIPDDNPFVSTAGARGEIWALGLRNPWRFGIDAVTGDIVLGDVGDNSREELDVIPGGVGGVNFGWARYEGANECLVDAPGCDRDGLTFSSYEYTHNEGCAIVGGPVYRGCAMPGHHGKAFFADHCEGWVRSLQLSAPTVPEVHDGLHVVNVGAFGTDRDGEIYVLDHAEGTVSRVVPAQ